MKVAMLGILGLASLGLELLFEKVVGEPLVDEYRSMY